MKNIVVLAAVAAFGGSLAMAAAPTTQPTVVMPMTATVANVCMYAPYDSSVTTSSLVTLIGQVGPAHNMIDVNGKRYAQGNANLGTYKANSASANGSRNPHIHRCTSFTNFAPELTNGALVLESAALKNASHALKALTVSWTLDTNGTVNDVPGVGDMHYGHLTFAISSVQWNSAAGRYSGKLKLNLNYN